MQATHFSFLLYHEEYAYLMSTTGKIFDATYIKLVLLDLLLKEGECRLIVNELPFLKEYRWADLFCIKGNDLIAYEIKSELDTVKTLNSQISDYQKIFNKVYAVISEKFVNTRNVKELSKYVGIIVVKSDGILKCKRNATHRTRFQKKDMVSLLWKKDLEMISRQNGTRETLERYIVEHVSRNTIHEKTIDALLRRYGDSYALFSRDCRDYATIDDLKTITGLKGKHYL